MICRGGGWIALAAAAFVVSGSGTAHAALVSGTVKVATTTIATATVSSPLVEGLSSGQNQLLDPVSSALCAPVTQLNATLGSVACAVSSLDFRFLTRLRTATGETVRTQYAIANLPTLLNVDDDILPDVIATVTVTSLTTFGLRIDRFLGETATLPLSVEALIEDPTGGQLPRERIAFGYDARETRAPQSWQATIKLQEGGRADDTASLEIEHETSGAGTALTVTGGLYDGDPLARSNPLGGRLTYQPVPPGANVGLTIGKRLQLRLGATAPSRLTGDVELVDGPLSKRARAVVDALPSSIVLDYEETGTDKRLATYTASAVVGRVDLDYRDEQAGTLLQRAVVHALRLPRGMRIEQTSKLAGNFQATGGSLGSVEVGFANGNPQLLPGATTPYAYMKQDGDLRSYAGRVDELVSASFAADLPSASTDPLAQAVVLDAELAQRTPFVLKLDLPDKRLDGRLEQLPRKLHVALDLPAGKVDYDGFGETIDKIAFDGTKTTPWFKRATHVAGEIRSVPPKVAIAFSPAETGSSANFSATAPVGKIEIAASNATNGSLEYPAGTEAGAVYRDTTDRYRVGARIYGLRSASFAQTQGGGASPTLADFYSLSTRVAPGPFTLAFENDTTEVDSARIADLPGAIDLQMVVREPVQVVGGAEIPGALMASYKADAAIGAITAKLRRKDTAKPFFGLVRKVDALIKDLPAEVNLQVVDGDNGISFGAGQELGLVDVRLSSGPTAPQVPGTESGGIVQDLEVSKVFTAAIRMSGVRQASMTTAQNVQTLQDETTTVVKVASQRLHLIYKTDDFTADVRTSEIPNDVTIKSSPEVGTLNYKANAGIGTIDAEITGNAAPLFGRVKRIGAHLAGIPDKLDVGFKPATGSGGAFDAPQGIDVVQVEMTDGGPADRFGDTRSGVMVRDLPDRYSLFAQLREVTGGSVTSSNRSIDATVLTGEIAPDQRQSFDLDAMFDVLGDAMLPAHVTARIPRLPGSVGINHSKDFTAYTASERIAKLELHARNLPGVTSGGVLHNIDAMIEGVPKDIRFTHSDSTTGFESREGPPDARAPIDRIDVELWDEDPRLEELPEDGRNKMLLQTRGDTFKAHVRVFGLTQAKLSSLPGRTEIETAFATPPPQPLDVLIRSGNDTVPSASRPEGPGPDLIDATIDQLPRTSKFAITQFEKLQTVFDWEADAANTDITLKDVISSGISIADMHIADLPTDVEFCIGERFGCGQRHDERIDVDEGCCGVEDHYIYTLRNTLNLDLQANGDVHIVRGKLCMPFTDDRGRRQPVPDDHPYRPCRPDDKNFITMDDVRVREFHFETSGQEVVESDGDGDTEEDDLTKIWLETDALGVRADLIWIVNTSTGSITRIYAPGPVGVRNVPTGTPFYAVIQGDFPPTIEDDGDRSGHLNCGDAIITARIAGFDVPIQALPDILGLCE